MLEMSIQGQYWKLTPNGNGGDQRIRKRNGDPPSTQPAHRQATFIPIPWIYLFAADDLQEIPELSGLAFVANSP